MHDCHGEMSYTVISKVMSRHQNLEDYSTKNIWPDTWSIILELMAIRTKNYIDLIWLEKLIWSDCQYYRHAITMYICWLFEHKYSLLESIIVHSRLVPSRQLLTQHRNTYQAPVVSVVRLLSHG